MITTTFSAKEAKNNFGRLLDEARHAPVVIERNGRRVAVVVSVERYAATEARPSIARRRQTRADDNVRARQRLTWKKMEAEADADIKAGRISKGYRTASALKRALDRLTR